jgi:hypothetical protein
LRFDVRRSLAALLATRLLVVHLGPQDAGHLETPNPQNTTDRGRSWICVEDHGHVISCDMETQTQARLRERLTQSVEKQRGLLEELERLIRDPSNSSATIDVQRRLSRLAAEQARLVAELEVAQLAPSDRVKTAAGLAGQRPMREQVLDILDELGVPVAPRVISEVALACYGRSLPAARFASLRRDEERAYRKDPTARPAWVVPVINVVGLTAIPRIIANSAWEAERRLIGARTLRTNHLKTLIALVNRTIHLSNGAAEPDPQLAALIARYAGSIGGAMAPVEASDFVLIRAAAEEELARIEPLDAEERHAAARRLAKLPAPEQLWGRAAFPLVIEGGAARSRAG